MSQLLNVLTMFRQKKSINQTMCNSDKTTVCDLHCANAQTLILIIITLLFEQWQENGMEIKS